MKRNLLVISHSYLDRENQKNLDALARWFNVCAVLPRRAAISLFADYAFQPFCSAAAARPIHAWHATPAQYLFLSFGYGLGAFAPHAILVEYNPWSLVYAQAVLYRALLYPKAKLVCFVKKNTYRRRGPILGALKAVTVPWLLGTADHFIAASSMAANLLCWRLGVDPRRISVEQHLGVDVKTFSPAPGRDAQAAGVVVGYCGRLDSDKGVLKLVEAVRRVRARVLVDVTLSLLGAGALGERIRQAAQAEPWLRVAAPVEHHLVPQFLRTLDIFAFPSQPAPDHEEHDAHTLIEAMACGLPCVATDVGRIPDLLGDDCGRLIDRDSPAALADAIARLVSDAAGRALMGRRARDRVCREFALDRLAARKAAILSGVIDL